MLFARQAPRVLVYEHPVDMRKSFDGLHAIASQVTQEDALSGVLFLFVNRSKSIMKILFWDRTGCWEAPRARKIRGVEELFKLSRIRATF
jgi:transposase